MAWSLRGAIRAVPAVTTQIVRMSIRHRITGLGAEVAFFAVLSVFPALLLVAAALGWLDVVVGHDLAVRAQDLVVNFLQRVLTTEAASTVQAVRQLFSEPRGEVLTVAGVVALYSTSRGFVGAIRAINVVYGSTDTRSWWRVRLLALAFGLGTIIVSVLLLTVMVAGPLIGHGKDLADRLGLGQVWRIVWDWLRIPIAFVLLVGWGLVVLHISSARRTRWRADLPGSILAATLWLTVSLGLSVYLHVVRGSNVVFGVLGGGLILLVWFYLMSLVLLVGGEMNAILASGPTDGPSSPPVTDAVG
jgi:membrane protein